MEWSLAVIIATSLSVLAGDIIQPPSFASILDGHGFSR